MELSFSISSISLIFVLFLCSFLFVFKIESNKIIQMTHIFHIVWLHFVQFDGEILRFGVCVSVSGWGLCVGGGDQPGPLLFSDDTN